jgi:hypothetical protein
MRRILLATFFLVSLCGGASAWGDTAHQVVCEMAFRLAKSATQAEIQRLINSDASGTYPDFSEACVLPDHPRIRAPEHFLNLPRDSAGLTSDNCPLAQKCVLTAILSDLKVLSDKNESDARKLLALESIGHWVGDIHQPLHVSFEDDRGGNTIKVSGCAGNLHAVWDSCLVNYAVGSDVAKASASLMAAITPAVQAQWINSSPRDWANETFAIAKAPATRYCLMHGQSCDQTDESLTITTEYLATNKSVVRVQLEKAAVRLANMLDKAFEN